MYRRHRQAQSSAAAWRSEVAKTLPDAKLTRDLLDDASRAPIDATHIETLQHQVDATADQLARLASTAPDPASREHTQAAEQALRGYIVAIKTEQMASQDRTTVVNDALAAGERGTSYPCREHSTRDSHASTRTSARNRAADSRYNVRS